MITWGETMPSTMEQANEFFESAGARENMRSTYREAIPEKVTLQCNECGKKRKVSPDGTYYERCPKCGGVDWDVL